MTLKVDANGACYYKAVARKKDGTSDVPRVDTGNSRVAVTANRSFVIYLKNLDTEKEFDLYTGSETGSVSHTRQSCIEMWQW